MVKLFIYGTLQDTVLLAKITRSRDIDDGYEVYDQLDGYTTVRHSCMPYPTIQIQANGLVTGKVLNVTDKQLSIVDSIDEFEFDNDKSSPYYFDPEDTT